MAMPMAKGTSAPANPNAGSPASGGAPATAVAKAVTLNAPTAAEAASMNHFICWRPTSSDIRYRDTIDQASTGTTIDPEAMTAGPWPPNAARMFGPNPTGFAIDGNMMSGPGWTRRSHP